MDKAWKMDSSNYMLQVSRGSTYECLERWEEAYNAYTYAINKYPDSAYGYQARAIFFYTIQYTDNAIADNTKALEVSTEDSVRLVCFSNRGNCYQQKRDFNHAYEDYSRAYLIDTNNIAVINNLATVLDELGRVDEALDFLRKVIRIDPAFIGSYVNLGFQYTRLGRYKEALDYFNQALKIDANDALTLNNRGLAYYHLKQYTDAMNDINRSLSIYPTNAYAFKNRALVYIALKDNKKACEDMESALKMGFTKMYGEEVVNLQKQHCGN